jgi:hypothetical protein
VNDNAILYAFLSGAVSCGFFICALMFVRFWRRTRDPLFFAFALAFALLGTGQGLLSLGNVSAEESTPIYLIRLAAFALIIFAIARKNSVRA